MRKTVKGISESKQSGTKLTMLTAYDASMSALLTKNGVDMLLVGDSLGMVSLGYDSTISVTMEDMIHHSAAVRRGAPDAFVVTDMPYGSYHVSIEDAVFNGVRLMKEGGCDAVKLEGGFAYCDTVKALVTAGVSVMAHIGLTPQTATQLGGYKVQGNSPDSARRLMKEAQGLEEAGAFAVLMECVPFEVAAAITGQLSVPTIGIGAGAGCDGQVLVTNDILGLFAQFTPKFVKKYADLSTVAGEAVSQYCEEVRSGSFPDESRSFSASFETKTLLEK